MFWLLTSFGQLIFGEWEQMNRSTAILVPTSAGNLIEKLFDNIQVYVLGILEASAIQFYKSDDIARWLCSRKNLVYVPGFKGATGWTQVLGIIKLRISVLLLSNSCLHSGLYWFNSRSVHDIDIRWWRIMSHHFVLTPTRRHFEYVCSFDKRYQGIFLQ